MLHLFTCHGRIMPSLAELLLPCFIEMLAVSASNVDPDQILHSAVSDLGQHCLPMSHLWDTRHKWVNHCLSVLQLTGFVSGQQRLASDYVNA